MGLVKAVDRFDPNQGVRFSTYAVPVIMGEIRRFLRDDGPVHVSRSIRENAAAIAKFREEYTKQNNREAEMDEICAGTGLSRESVLLALNACQRVRSLNEPAGGEDAPALMDTIGRETMGEVDSRIALSQLLRELSTEERSIIIRRYFYSHTQTAIARDMGVSQVQVSRLESRILKRLRQRAEG